MNSNLNKNNTSVPLRYWYLMILALSGFVTSFGAHIVATNLPAYAQTVGVGAFTIGLLIAVYDFAELFAKPAAGFIADRRGMKMTLLAGIGIFILGSLLFLVLDPKLLLVVRFIQGLGAAALSTVSITLVIQGIRRHGRAASDRNAYAFLWRARRVCHMRRTRLTFPAVVSALAWFQGSSMRKVPCSRI